MKIDEFLVYGQFKSITKVKVIYSFEYENRIVVVHETLNGGRLKYTASDYLTSMLLCKSNSKDKIKDEAKKVLDEASKREKENTFSWSKYVKVNSDSFIKGFNHLSLINDKDYTEGVLASINILKHSEK